MALSSFHPIIQRWFSETLGEPTAAQRQGWAAIRERKHTLIAAPTGSGKTLAAFLTALDDLLQEGLRAPLPDEVRVVYVSPLKALSADIHKNLAEPRKGIRRIAEELGLDAPRITAAVRTGDTTSSERAAMLRKPPHILVTTPESLYLLLTAERSREMLRTARTVIVDEIHAVIGTRRGAHLALTLERLQKIADAPLLRLGLSATQKPIEDVARYLTANGDCTIVDEGHRREMDLSIEVPRSALETVMSHEVWEEYYDRITALIHEHRTTLVFVNTRRMAERVARHLSDRLGDDAVTAHHGSLSKEKRLDAETRLKNGQLKALVATASLELGIDIGHVDLVCQIGSPHRIATLLQRVGRSGHTVSGTPKGRIFPMSLDDLVECAALLRAVRQGELDRIVAHEAPLDVLAQQIVAESACADHSEDELYALMRRAWPYRELARKDFDDVLKMVADGFATKRGRRGALVHRDEVNAEVRGRRGSRMLAITSGGAIPEVADYRVILEGEDTFIGTLNEDFAIESTAGDIFQLGNASWRIVQVTSGTVRVADAKGAPPTIPFWLGEAPARSDELSRAVSELRLEMQRHISSREPRGAQMADPNDVPSSGASRHPLPAARGEGHSEVSGESPSPGLRGEGHSEVSGESPSPRVRGEGARRADEGRVIPSEARNPLPTGDAGDSSPSSPLGLTQDGIPEAAAIQINNYFAETQRILGELPTQDTLIAERFFDESGGMQLVIHSPFGSRINKAWGLALRKRFCRQFNFELQAAATEDAVLLSLGPQHSFPLADVFRYLHPATARDVLVQAFLDAPVFQTRWRWNTTISLAIPRNRNGRKIPPQLQRSMADDLMAAVFPDAAACFENIAGDREIPDQPLVNQTVRDCLEEAMDFDGLAEVLTRIHNGTIRCLARDTPEPSPLAHEILNAKPYAFLDDAPLEERRTQAVYARRVSSSDELGVLDAAAIERVRDEERPDPRDADELHDALLTASFLTEDEAAELPRALFDALAAARRAAFVHGLWITAERLPELLAVHPAIAAPIAAPPSRNRAWTREEALVELIRGRMSLAGPATARALAHSLDIEERDADLALLALESEGVVLRGSFESREPEWCDRRLLARIHRYTLHRLRAEIEPVTAADFMRFLFEWQHATPSSRLAGVDGLLQVIAQLDGFEVAASAWERNVLPLRVAQYEPSLLDMLCLGGEVSWARMSSAPTSIISATPIALFLRDHASAWRTGDPASPDTQDGLSSTTQGILETLRTRGASFARDLGSDEALGELVSAGLITSDGFAGLRALISANERRALAGRWSLLDLPASELDVETQARVLLRRYGIVFRRLAARESNTAPWRELARVYRRMEARGELRGGRFVTGMSGEQFALPEAVEKLREIRRTNPDHVLHVITASDPLNLTGILTTGERVRAVAATRIAYRDGAAVSVMEGDSLRPLTDTGSDLTVAAALAGRRVAVGSGWVGR
jgi:ATP-dependent Lhr-like helicase